MDLEQVRVSATIIVISKDNKALIIQRPPNKSFAGLWTVAGGKVSTDDGYVVNDSFRYFPAEDCAIRELYEETGISVRRADLEYLCSIIALGEIKRLILSYYVVLDNLNAEDVRIKLAESQAYKWITEDEIKDNNFIIDIGGEIREVFKRLKK